jgi:hypothetical protein
MNTHDKLIAALTAYDRKQSTKRDYNHYALAQYFARVDDVHADIAAGASVRAALVAAFCGRLLDVCLKAVGESKSTDDDQRLKSLSYRPATRS